MFTSVPNYLNRSLEDVTSSHGGNESTSSMQSSSGGPAPMPLYAQLATIVLYTSITLIGIGGNLIVCYVVLAYHRMRTVTNYFILNLACSDALMATLCVPFTFVANVLLLWWPFSHIMCPIMTYAQGVTVFLSAFTLVAISFDRYVAIIFPLKPRMRSRHAFVVIATIWALSLGVCSPVALKSGLVEANNSSGGPQRCEEVWADNAQRYVYSMALMMLQYFAPLCVLMFTYTHLGFVIWVKKTPGEAENNRDRRLAASKRKMIKMMITVVIINALCWLPLHTITLVGDSHPSMWTFEHIQLIWVSCHWLAMSTCCYNPIVYCWMNSKYRNGFRYVLRFLPCVTFDKVKHDPNQVTGVHTYVSNMRVTTNSTSVGGVNSIDRILASAAARDARNQSLISVKFHDVTAGGAYSTSTYDGERVPLNGLATVTAGASGGGNVRGCVHARILKGSYRRQCSVCDQGYEDNSGGQSGSAGIEQ